MHHAPFHADLCTIHPFYSVLKYQVVIHPVMKLSLTRPDVSCPSWQYIQSQHPRAPDCRWLLAPGFQSENDWHGPATYLNRTAISRILSFCGSRPVISQSIHTKGPSLKFIGFTTILCRYLWTNTEEKQRRWLRGPLDNLSLPEP